MKAKAKKSINVVLTILFIIFPITITILTVMAKKIRQKFNRKTSDQLTKNFWLYEFNSKDGVPVPPELIPNVKKLAENLQVLRDYLGKPIRINSGYRSPGHNKTIGGQSNSYHMRAMAADIDSNEVTPDEFHKAITHLIQTGKMTKGGLKQYSGWVHYDIRGHMASW